MGTFVRVGVRFAALLVVLALAAGCADCGGRGAGGDADGGGDAGGDAAAADAVVGGTLAVLVRSWGPWPANSYGSGAGAVVALDEPGGGRAEAVADGEGRVTFTGFDWAAGTAAVTAYLEGHSLASRVGIAADDGEVELVLFSRAAPSGLVEVSGIAVNMRDWLNHAVDVTATAPSIPQLEGVRGGEWSILVQPGVPFVIVATEVSRLGGNPTCGPGCFEEPIFAWTAASVPAVTGPATADLDFAAALTTTALDGSFTLPARADSPLRATMFCGVDVTTASSSNAAKLGHATRYTALADGAGCEYRVEWATVAGLDLHTVYFAWAPDPAGGMGWGSSVGRLGPPGEGAQDLRLLDVPRFLSAAGAPLHDPLSWELFDADVDGVLLILWREGVGEVWSVAVPPGVTTVQVPLPPASVDVTPVLGTDALGAMVYVSRSHDGVGDVAYTASLPLVR